MKEQSFQAARLLRAISNPVRFQILELLRQRARTPGAIAAELHRSPTSISQHLRVLRSLDLVLFDRRWKRRVYRIKGRDVYSLLSAAARCVRNRRQIL